MPTASCSTLATGARQLVVHDALEMMWWLSASYVSSKLTPSATVASGSVAGAEMITFLAPASRCLAASSRLVNRPVDSITTSAPRSPHGSAAGSRSASTLTSRPSIASAPSRTSTVPGNGPKTESYLSRCASVPASVMSLTATTSMSACDSCAARNMVRPMRPNPLIPTRTGISSPLCVMKRRRRGYPARRSGGQVLSDRHRAVPAARAADRHHQVGLALGDVLGQQVLEQRQHVGVELLQPPVAAHVVDDPLVEPRQRPQVGLVMRVREEAHVERQVGVARRAVLVAERGEGDRQAAGRLALEQLVGDLSAQPVRAQA